MAPLQLNWTILRLRYADIDGCLELKQWDGLIQSCSLAIPAALFWWSNNWWRIVCASLQGRNNLCRVAIAAIQWDVESAVRAGPYLLLVTQHLPHPEDSRVAHSYVILPFANVLRKREALFRTTRCRSCIGLRIFTFILQHNVWFGQEPDCEAACQVLSRYIGPIWQRFLWNFLRRRDLTLHVNFFDFDVHLYSFFLDSRRIFLPTKSAWSFSREKASFII